IDQVLTEATKRREICGDGDLTQLSRLHQIALIAFYAGFREPKALALQHEPALELVQRAHVRADGLFALVFEVFALEILETPLELAEREGQKGSALAPFGGRAAGGGLHGRGGWTCDGQMCIDAVPSHGSAHVHHKNTGPEMQ